MMLGNLLENAFHASQKSPTRTAAGEGAGPDAEPPMLGLLVENPL